MTSNDTRCEFTSMIYPEISERQPYLRQLLWNTQKRANANTFGFITEQCILPLVKLVGKQSLKRFMKIFSLRPVYLFHLLYFTEEQSMVN